jgi:heme exporter protein B
LNTFLATLKRDLLVHTRHPADVFNPLVFFMIVISLFPLGIGPSQETLRMIAPGVVWVAALLATLMSMDLIFKSDYEDGSLEQMLVAEAPLLPLVLAKIVSHWLVAGLPLVILTPLISLTYFLDATGMFVLTLSLLLVSPTLSLLGAIGAALTVSLARGGLVVAILILPLYVPVLILATAMVQTGIGGGDYLGYVFWLVAILSLSLGLAPLATSFSLRVSLEQ